MDEIVSYERGGKGAEVVRWRGSERAREGLKRGYSKEEEERRPKGDASEIREWGSGSSAGKSKSEQKCGERGAVMPDVLSMAS